MNVTGKTKIYRNDFDGRPSYSRSIASKEFKDGKQTDKWVRTYESVKLPKDATLTDGSMIDVTRGFEAVYKTSTGEIRRQLVVLDYTLEEPGDAPSGFMKVDDPLDGVPW